MGIIQKEKYFEYSSEQAIEAINRCSELYREYVVFKQDFDCGIWGFGCFTVIDDLGPGSKLLAVICWISVIHEYLQNNEETWDDGAEFSE